MKTNNSYLKKKKIRRSKILLIWQVTRLFSKILGIFRRNYVYMRPGTKKYRYGYRKSDAEPVISDDFRTINYNLQL